MPLKSRLQRCRNKRRVPTHDCVVRGDGVEHVLDPRHAEHEENRQVSNTEHTGQKLSPPRSLSGVLRYMAGLRRCLRGCRVVRSRRISIRCWLRVDRTRLVALLGHIGHPLQTGRNGASKDHRSSLPETYLGRRRSQHVPAAILEGAIHPWRAGWPRLSVTGLPVSRMSLIAASETENKNARFSIGTARLRLESDVI